MKEYILLSSPCRLLILNKQFYEMSGIAEKSGGEGLWEQIRYWEGEDGLDTVKVKIYTLTYHIIYMTLSILCPFDNFSSILTYHLCRASDS